MRDTVERILDGKFEYGKGSLEFSCQRLELTLNPDEVYTGSFGILSTPGKMTTGYLYSKDLRLQLLTDSFAGTGENIGYTFSAEGLSEGDVVKGEISVISNQGEYFLPYLVNIAHTSMETSLGSIRNLFHFANLAKTNWNEAVDLFYQEGFESLFKGNDSKYLRVYRALSAYYGNEQNVEEFLLEINKKQPIEYLQDRETVTLEDPLAETECSVDITRNGWGYTSLSVITDCDFIRLSAFSVGPEDFDGNFLHYAFYVDPEKLHEGSNFGSVRFFNPHVLLEVKVKATHNGALRPEIARDLEYRRAQVEMITYYKAFRLKHISADTWIAETSALVDRMAVLKENDCITRMYKAQLMITQERYNEARWILDQVNGELSLRDNRMTTEQAYYLYLTTLIRREDPYIDKITEEVETIYNADPTQWRVAWLLLYLSEEYAVSPAKKWLFLSKQLSISCTSPVMYVEAANLLALNPSFLNRLDDVEVRVLRFMVRENLLTGDLARQIVYLAGTGKWYSESILFILEKCYEIIPEAETLTALCNLLITHDRKEPEFFQWYKLALEAECRVTGIYEYYMNSLDLSIPVRLPKNVYLYFSYENTLDWEHTAYLYARVLENRRADEETFESYRETIERFTVREIADGHINRDMAAIYKYVLKESVITREMADRLVSLLFTERIVTDSKMPTKVIIYQSHELGSAAYPIRGGEAFVPVYNKDYTIVFEDDLTNRFTRSVNFDIEKLMIPGKLANSVLPFIKDNISFDVYACECSSEMVEITEENRDRYQRILDAVEIEPAYKTEIRSKLMQYYYENDRIRELDALLEAMDPTQMLPNERKTACGFMILRGMYDRALQWILNYGPEDMEERDLLKLSSRLIQRSDFEPSREITCIAAHCFSQGKYDETTLSYLCGNFNGMTRDLRKIFRTAEDRGIDTKDLCDRLLLQILYTGYYVPERVDIYRTAVAGDGDFKIRKAFLTKCAYEYFVKDQLTESYIFEEINRLLRRGEDFITVVKLAYIRYYAENRKEADGYILENVRDFLGECMGKNLYFSCFKDFLEDISGEISGMDDKTFIEYKTEPGKKVLIHYIVEHNEEKAGEYVTEEMRDMYEGIHVKSFVLFFGENLLYYITEEENGEEALTQSGSISKSDISQDIQNSRFNEINDIVIANTLKDYDTLESLITEYERKEYMVSRLFTME